MRLYISPQRHWNRDSSLCLVATLSSSFNQLLNIAYIVYFYWITAYKISQEPDELSDDFEDKSSTLLMMNFSVEEVEFAIRKLGM